jgi:hypothetical protein
MYEETDEVIELLTYISEFYTTVLKQQIHYLKPDVLGLMDDDAAYRAPFFSVDMYTRIFKPFHKLHTDLALDAGCVISRHDCGKCEQFIDDWLDLGIAEWNPAQTINDCKGIKAKYGNRLALAGCWDGTPWVPGHFTEAALKDAMAEYVDTFAPGGGFSFSVMIGGPFGDPAGDEGREIIKNFYFDYVRDWYKTH